MANPLSSIARGVGSANHRAGKAEPPSAGQMSPLTQSYNEWSFGRAYGNALPRDWQTFDSGAFSPLAPIIPVGIDTPEDDGRPMPRRWEYSVGWNMPVGQPGDEGLKVATFATLRSFADLYSVIRACITHITNDVLSTEWDIMPTAQAEHAMHGNQKAQDDFAQRREQAMKFWSRPDPQYPNWAAWMRALLEDHAVLDAVSLYLHPTRAKGHGPFGSDLASLDVLDGSTIRPLVDVRGSTPAPPDVAYQQYVWGVPRVDMTVPVLADDQGVTTRMVAEYVGDQLLYLPYYPRTFTPYGFSNVERALIPAATGLRRQMYAMQYYAEGSIPAVYVTPGPDIATPHQIAQLQRALNNIAGDQAWKHKVIVLPPGSKTDPQKTINLADQFDQVLAAEVTMAFEMTPMDIGMTPRVSAVQSPGETREFSQINAQKQQKRGLKPRLDFFKKSVFDFVIQRVWGQTDMEWKWTGIETGEDLEAKVAIWTSLVKSGIASIDQAAQEFGLDPWGLPETTQPILITSSGPIQLSGGLTPEQPVQEPSAPEDVELQRERGRNHPAARPTAAPTSKPVNSPAVITPAHHAARQAEADKPETHPAAKAAEAELRALTQYLRKGQPLEEFVPKVLSPRIMGAFASEPDVDKAAEHARRVLRALSAVARRDLVLRRLIEWVTRQLARLATKLRRGLLSTAQFVDAAIRVMREAYQEAMATGSQHAAQDHDIPVQDFTADAEHSAEDQRQYLLRLLSAVMSAKRLEELAARLALYADTVAGAYNAAYGQTIEAAHAEVLITWHLGDTEHCPLCHARDGHTYTFDTLPGYPGTGGFSGPLCEGGPRCGCWLSYDVPSLAKSEKTPYYSVTHHPLGTEGLWHYDGLQLPAYIQNVAKGIMESGHSREEAIPMAINTIKRWAAGEGHVHPEVREASRKALAEWDELKATHNKSKR